MAKSSKKALTHNKKVILLSREPTEWKFWDFKQNGNNQIVAWYDGLSEDPKNMFDALLKNNQKVKNLFDWTGFRRYLKGALEGSGIWELGFFSGVQYRVVGYCGPKRMEATLLIGCSHKGKVYDPPNALNTALTRKRMLEGGTAVFDERKIATDR